MNPPDFNIVESTSAPTHIPAPRFILLYAVLIIAITILLGRSFYLQIVKGNQFLSAAEGNRVNADYLTAPRGIITDTFGRQLTENITSTDLVLDPVTLPSPENEAPLIEQLPGIISVTSQEVREAINATRQTQRVTRLAIALEHEQVLAIEQAQANLPGLKLVSSLVRRYPQGHITAHILGYTSPVDAQELASRNDLKPTDITGKTGLEKQYDSVLHGIDGYSYIEVDAAGRPQKQTDNEEPIPGYNMQLTLDLEFQQFIMDSLAELNQSLQSEEEPQPPLAASVVALDPRSGAVRALVSYPSFDPNSFSQPALREQSENIVSDELQPLFNRAITGTYPPGSTIKPLLAASALSEKVINANYTINSTGGLDIGPWHFPDWKAGGHGVTDVTKAIAESVNTFFYLSVGGDATHTGLGVDRAVKYLSRFGWGEPTGIDLPNEAAGLLPTPDWKLEAKQEKWYIGDTYHLAIGQGDVLATPLQITTAIAAIANDGHVNQPFLVKSTSAPNDDPIPVTTNSRSLKIRKSYLDLIQQGMRRTITDGSGRRLSSLPVALAGKTGTAQVGGTEKTHAWFVSFGPYQNPQLVFTVLLEKGGEGDKNAVPFAEKIWQWWIDNRHDA